MIIENPVLLSILGAAGSAALGAASVPAAAALDKFLDKYRPFARKGFRVMRLLDEGMLDGDSRLKMGIYSAAFSYAEDLFKAENLKAEDLQRIARWVQRRFSARVHDQKVAKALTTES